MPQNCIAHIPDTRAFDNTSRKCQLWLKYRAAKERIRIKHAANGREVMLGKYKLDGYCKENNTFYEFHGMFRNIFAMFCNIFK